MLPNPEIFGITIDWYWLFHRSAIILAFVFFISWYKIKKPFELSIVQSFLLISALVIVCYLGARIFAGVAFLAGGGSWSVIEELWDQFGAGGYRWYGALITLLVCFPLFIKIFTLEKFAKILDVLGLTFCLFTAVVKQACLFAGDSCYGVYTTLPVGMYFPYGTAPNFLPVHPTPLYDSIFHLIFFIGLIYFIKRARFFGQVGLLYLMGTSVFNFFLEIIRTNPEVGLGLTFAQWSNILIFSISYFILVKMKNHDQLIITRKARTEDLLNLRQDIIPQA